MASREQMGYMRTDCILEWFISTDHVRCPMPYQKD